jgi:hypothetical protein
MAQEDKNLAPNLLSTHLHTGLDGTKRIKGTHIVNLALLGTSAATTANYSVFFNVPFPCEVISVRESHTTAGSDAGTVTVTVEKLTGTTAPGGGVTLLSSALSLKATANTVQTGTLTLTKNDRRFLAGHRLAALLSGTPTAVANMVLTVELLEL